LACRELLRLPVSLSQVAAALRELHEAGHPAARDALAAPLPPPYGVQLTATQPGGASAVRRAKGPLLS
jgi:hypothetical protein